MQAGTYTFDQLSDRLMEEAIEANRDINTHYDWHGYAIEEFKEDLADEGVSVDDVQFTGFYSQGDGASFTGEVEDMKKFLVETVSLTEYSDDELDELPADVKEKVEGFVATLTISFNRKESRYSHVKTCQADTWSEIVRSTFYEDEYPDYKILFTNRVLTGNPIVFMDLEHEESRIDEIAEEWRLKQCIELYRSLEDEYDSLQSDEAVAETLESNGTEFEVDEDGELVI